MSALADLRERGDWTVVGTGLTYNPTGGRNGQGCVSFTTTGSSAHSALSLRLQNRPSNIPGALSTMKVGFAFRWNFPGAANTARVLQLCSFYNTTDAWHGVVRMFHNGTNWVIAYYATFAGATYTIGPSITSGTWYHVEVEISDFRGGTNGSSPGVQSISVNGTAPQNSIGLTSANGVTSGQTVGFVKLNSAGNTSWSQGTGESVDYDDFHCGSIGAVGTIANPNLNMIGDMRVDCLQPDGDGFYTDFTPLSGGNRFSMVDDPAGHDGDTTYAFGTTLNQKMTVTLEDLPHNPPSIYAISPFYVARREGVASRSSRAFLRVGGTDYTSTVTHDVSHTTSYQGGWHNVWASQMVTNPATSLPYTKTDLQTLEIGVEINV